MQRSSLVDPGHHCVLCAVEAVHLDHTGFGLHVGVVGVGGVQIILKHSQPVQVLNLKEMIEKRKRGKWVLNFIRSLLDTNYILNVVWQTFTTLFGSFLVKSLSDALTAPIQNLLILFYALVKAKPTNTNTHWFCVQM